MSKRERAIWLLIFTLPCLWSSGIIPAIIPAAVPTAFKRGNSSKFQLATSGAVAANDCASFDATGNIQSAGVGTCTGSAGAGNTITLGAYASLPGSSASTGNMYVSSDAAYKFIWSGSVWQAWFGGFPAVIPPSVGSLTWVNQGGATASNNLGTFLMAAPQSATDNVRSLVVSMPGGSWSFTMMMAIGVPSVNFYATGISVRDSATSRIIVFGPGYDILTSIGQKISVTRYTNDTTFSANSAAQGMIPAPLWLRIADDTTNFTWSFSFDGANFVQFFQESRTAFLAAPNQVGISLNNVNNTNGTINAQITSWDIH